MPVGRDKRGSAFPASTTNDGVAGNRPAALIPAYELPRPFAGMPVGRDKRGSAFPASTTNDGVAYESIESGRIHASILRTACVQTADLIPNATQGLSSYKRIYTRNGTYFFTVVTFRRHPWFAHHRNVERLKMAIRYVQMRRPFKLDAIVVLPDHLHCIWTMTTDENYSVRWQMLKTRVTRAIRPQTVDKTRRIWQPRFWEHGIRDDIDFERHLDYIHYNPVKHGYVQSAADWPYSSFRSYMDRGCYPPGWGCVEPASITTMKVE